MKDYVTGDDFSVVNKSFDVFLAHSSVDKPKIRELYERLKREGVQPWLDEKELVGGTLVGGLQKAILESRAAAICVGSTELSPWQTLEFETILRECVEGHMRIIPVLLPGVNSIPSSLPFLRAFVWVSFQYGLDDRQAMAKLVRSIESAVELPPTAPSSPPSLDWDREWFVNAGEGKGSQRSWEDCRKYGFISAGQGLKFAKMMKKLEVDDRVYAYVTGSGYVGLGKVVEKAVPIREFMVAGGVPLLAMSLEANGLGENQDNDEYCEWVVRIDWRKTFSKEQAFWRKGLFHHLGTACRFKNQETLNCIHEKFDIPAKF